MNLWIIGKNFMKLLTRKREFCNESNMEYFIDSDYSHKKRIRKDFEIKNLCEYHNFYLKSETLLPGDILGNFTEICLEIYELDPAKFLSFPGLTWQAAFKKYQIKLGLLTDIYMLLMLEERENVILSIDMQKLITNI